MEHQDPNRKVIQEDEIDLLELAKVIWSKRKFIAKVTGAFMALGLLIAFTSRVEYEASCKLMPESQEGMEGSLGGLGSLAGLAGINLNMGGAGSLTPELYPEIVQSLPFQLDLIHQPVYFEALDTTLSSYTYFTQIQTPTLFGWVAEYTLGLPGKIKRLLVVEAEPVLSDPSDNLIRISKEDWEWLERYREKIHVSVDSKTGIISVSTEMPDAYAAAKITDLVVSKLTTEVTRYKIEKVQTNLDFIAERYEEAEKSYEIKQRQVASFTDQNKNISSSMVQTEFQRLQNELNIAFEVYKGLATQLEQAKIQVKEQTPVFTVLEPVKVPVEKSKPRRPMIIILFFFLGLILSTFFLFFTQLFEMRPLK